MLLIIFIFLVLSRMRQLSKNCRSSLEAHAGFCFYFLVVFLYYLFIIIIIILFFLLPTALHRHRLLSEQQISLLAFSPWKARRQTKLATNSSGPSFHQTTLSFFIHVRTKILYNIHSTPVHAGTQTHRHTNVEVAKEPDDLIKLLQDRHIRKTCV